MTEARTFPSENTPKDLWIKKIDPRDSSRQWLSFDSTFLTKLRQKKTPGQLQATE